MSTILNSIAILCLAISYVIHLIYFHMDRPKEKFEITKEELENQIKLQKYLDRKAEENIKIRKKITENVPTSSRNTESKQRYTEKSV